MASTTGVALSGVRTPLNRQQKNGFWAAWTGWLLDGMDSVTYALVLAPAMKDLLPNSGITATPGHIGLYGSILFALFLVGWGLSFVWGPIADRHGRARTLMFTIRIRSLYVFQWFCSKHLGTGHFPSHRGHWDWRGMVHARNIDLRIVARKSAKNGLSPRWKTLGFAMNSIGIGL